MSARPAFIHGDRMGSGEPCLSDAQIDALDLAKAANRADLETVLDTLWDLPCLAYSLPTVRRLGNGETFTTRAVLTGAETIAALLSDDDAALLTAARRIRDQLTEALDAQAEARFFGGEA